MVHCSKCGKQNPEGARYCNNCAAALALNEPMGPQGAPGQEPGQTQPPLQTQPSQKATLLDYLSHYKGLQYHWVGRFVALVLDVVIIMIPVYVIMAFAGLAWGGFLGYLGFGGIILFLYSGFMEQAKGATLGKMVMGFQVVPIEGQLDLAKTLIRNITKIYSLLLLIEFIVTLVVETTDAHQRYLDKLAKTTVIQKR